MIWFPNGKSSIWNVDRFENMARNKCSDDFLRLADFCLCKKKRRKIMRTGQ